MAKGTCIVNRSLGIVKWNNKILVIHEISLFKTVVQTVIVYFVNCTMDASKDVWQSPAIFNSSFH